MYLKSSELKIIKILTKTKAKMFSDLKVGDNLQISLKIHRVGRTSGGSRATNVKVTDLTRNISVFKTMNELPKILDCFEFEEVQAREVLMNEKEKLLAQAEVVKECVKHLESKIVKSKEVLEKLKNSFSEYRGENAREEFYTDTAVQHSRVYALSEVGKSLEKFSKKLQHQANETE